jgi:LacI family transcriptional regulator
MEPMAVRLKDIASDLGVSVVTVSKVLRNHSDISEETRRKVLKRIKEMNYRPNLAARALITGRSNTVGLIVPDLLHPFFGQVAKAMSGALRARGYGLLISSSEDDAELERSEIESLLARRVDAVVLASAQSSAAVSLQQIEEQKVPCVLIDRRVVGRVAHYIGVDDEAVGQMATAHLIEQGCRRIAHIRGPQVSTSVGRLEGYKRALAAAGIPFRSELVVPVGASGDDRGEPGGRHAMSKLLAGKVKPDAVFCYNDPVALGAMRAILEAGLRIPADVAVIGCGNITYGDLLRVPLSTVDQDSERIGTAAAELALQLIEAKTPPRPQAVLLSPHLVSRQSSLRQPAAK